MTKGKRLKVESDTQIHMSTTYTRNGRGSKDNSKRAFNFVIKGLMISTALVGSILTTNVADAFANGNKTDAGNANKPVGSSSVKDYYQDESAMISNLKMANKVLEAAIKSGQLNASVYENVMKRIVAIDAKLTMDGSFEQRESLITVLDATGVTLGTKISTTNQDILLKRASSIEALAQVRGSLGIKETVFKIASTDQPMAVIGDEEEQPLEVIGEETSTPTITVAAPKTEVAGVSSTKAKAVTSKVAPVTINNVKQSTALNGVVKNKIAYVPARGVFEKLGAKFTYDSKNRILVATKGKTVMKVKVGNSTATINGKAFKMGATAHVHGKNTVVPVSLVKATFGGTVTVDAKGVIQIKTTTTAVKPAPPKPAPVVTKPAPTKPVVNGIKVDFGKHTYGSKNQAEYDKVNAYVTKGMAGYKNKALEDNTYRQRFLNGERASSYVRGSADNMGLTFAERSMGSLVKNGVSKEVIIDVVKAGLTSTDITTSVQPKTLTTGSPNSAYHHLFSGITDCDAYAQLVSANFDRAGYVTAVISKPGHAEVIVKVNGKWYLAQADAFNHVSSTWLSQNGFKVFTPATDGSAIN